MEWTRKWKEEGLQEGEKKGKLEGKLEGKQELLQTLLESRFGPLPEWALVRLQASQPGELEKWTLRVLSQSSLQDVLN